MPVLFHIQYWIHLVQLRIIAYYYIFQRQLISYFRTNANFLFFLIPFPYSTSLTGVCQFGLAHVDTPKGDLDASSGVLTGPGVNVIANDAVYPEGTTEQFPEMKDSRGSVLTNSAHYYRECSNKGICDRSSGSCSCFEGYDGSACQRASCPSSSNGVCSGHGTCNTIQELSAMDNENIYRLWDEDVTMGCKCDPGFEGTYIFRLLFISFFYSLYLYLYLGYLSIFLSLLYLYLSFLYHGYHIFHIE